MFENQDVEFKKIWKDEWLEWICGFANTTGGMLDLQKIGDVV